jgi:tRNA(fMet)-specific endonuclease VapC
MIDVMLDANACIRIIRRRPKSTAERFKRHAGAIAISTIVFYELSFGAVNSERPDLHREKLEEFTSGIKVLPFDDIAGDHAADIRLDLSRRGQIIGPMDILIAGHARSLNSKLITGNLREFQRVDGLRCEDWF